MTKNQQAEHLQKVRDFAQKVLDLKTDITTFTSDSGINSRETSLVQTKLDEARHWLSDTHAKIKEMKVEEPAPAATESAEGFDPE